MTLADLAIRDIRTDLTVVASSSRARRSGAITSLTLHYNGPPVAGHGRPDAELRQVIFIDTPNHQSRLGADSLQYHFVVLSDGVVCQSRDLDLIAWHCANAVGNRASLAIHLPLGGAQDATERQWHATTRLFESLCAEYRLARSAVYGHREWRRDDGKSQGACPGPRLFRRLQLWRGGQPAARYVVTTPSALVREGPGQAYRVALGGTCKLARGTEIEIDAIVAGTVPFGGTGTRWAHLADGRGFVYAELLRRL